jgi:hypothetical protein
MDKSGHLDPGEAPPLWQVVAVWEEFDKGMRRVAEGDPLMTPLVPSLDLAMRRIQKLEEFTAECLSDRGSARFEHSAEIEQATKEVIRLAGRRSVASLHVTMRQDADLAGHEARLLIAARIDALSQHDLDHLRSLPRYGGVPAYGLISGLLQDLGTISGFAATALEEESPVRHKLNLV